MGWAPAFDVVRAHVVPGAYLLGALHLLLVPVVLAIGSSDPAVTETVPVKSAGDKVAGYAFAGFLVMGWLAPVCAYNIGRVPGWLVGATILVHIAPVILLVVLALLEAVFGAAISRGVETFVRLAVRVFTVPNLTVLFALYLTLVEVFLLMVKARHGDLGGIAVPAWAISYLPTRLFFARITGLRGPERWTFALANLHLLARLMMAHPDPRLRLGGDDQLTSASSRSRSGALIGDGTGASDAAHERARCSGATTACAASPTDRATTSGRPLGMRPQLEPEPNDS